MDPITRRQRIAQVPDRMRHHLSRGREHVSGISRQFWQGLVTGIALSIVAMFVIVILKAPA